MKPTLTRYLYLKEDVKHSLIFCLLKKPSFEECLFWTSEYYYSGYFTELWKLIWKIYYDFYAIIRPKLEKFITKMQKKWKIKSKIIYILHVLKNLYYSDISPPIVFLVRMALETQKVQTKSYRGRPPAWLKGNKKYKNLLMSIHNKHYQNTAYYLRRFKNEEPELYNAILNYYQGDNLNNQLSSLKIYDSGYQDKLHILIDTIFHLSLEDKNTNARCIHLQITKKELKYAIDTNIISTGLHHVLKEKRTFKIRTEIGCFKLRRYDPKYPNIQQIQWHHWEYFAYNTPLWKERFDKYKIKINHDKFLIEFEDEMTTSEQYEEFHEKYYYEPDEQSKEVQEKSIANIPEISINDWLNNIFGKQKFFHLDDKNKYTY